MKLLVSALVVLATAATASVVSAQESARSQNPAQTATGIAAVTTDTGQSSWPLSPKDEAAQDQAEAQVRAQMQILFVERMQTGCPVTLTSAHLNWPATYLPVTSAEKVTEPNLTLGFRNSSGKPIRSVTITAQFLAKQNLYQLDAGAFDLQLTFSGVDAANRAADQLRKIQVQMPGRVYPYGVTRVTLDQVTFGDGTFWMSAGHNTCRLDVTGNAERVAK